MRTVKFTLIFLSMQWAALCTAQRNRPFDSLHINASNAAAYFLNSKSIIDNQKRDSLFDASSVLRKLYYFDSSIYSKQTISLLFDKISAINLEYYQKKIIGQWYLAFRGSNWSTNNYGDTSGEMLQISNDRIRFLKSGKVIRDTKYLLTNKYALLSKEFEFQLYFFDTDLYWHIGTKDSYFDFYSKLQFDKDHIGLFVDSGPFCNNCGYEIYMKEIQKVH